MSLCTLVVSTTILCGSIPGARYSAALENLPEDQGWTYVNTNGTGDPNLYFNPRVRSHSLIEEGATPWSDYTFLDFPASGYTAFRYYERADVEFSFDNDFEISARLRFHNSIGGNFWGFSVSAIDSEARLLSLDFSQISTPTGPDGVNAIYRSSSSTGYTKFGVDIPTGGNFKYTTPFLQPHLNGVHTYKLTYFADSGTLSLWIDDHKVTSAVVVLAQHPSFPACTARFGDHSTGGGFPSSLVQVLDITFNGTAAPDTNE